MSVLVKNMEMPHGSCEWRDKHRHFHRCLLLGDENDCKMQDTITETWEEQFAGCPLVEIKEPHGRLIDATFEENHYASMLLNPTPDVTEQDKHKARIIIEALRMARTVIEAVGSEK